MRRRVALLVAGLLWFAGAAAGIDVRASYGARVTGDEPHYLLTALSLAEDQDLNVSDEIAARRYRAFHEVALNPQSKLLEDGGRVSPHDPLLPLVLALPILIGGWMGAKLFLAAIAALLGALLLWVALERFAVPRTAALLTTALFGLSAPFAVYGSQIYPELPAALAVTVAIAALTGPLRAIGLVVLGLAVVTLPWLSVKYAPVALVLAGLAAVSLLRRRSYRSLAFLGGGLVAAAVAFAVAHLQWYGGLTPYATGDHFVAGELSVVGFEPDFLGRSRRLIGLVVDDKFGLAAWQPAWLLALPALGALVACRPRGWHVLGAPLTAGWLTATFVALTMQGWWFPGRQLIVVLPALVLAVTWWAGGGRWRLPAVAALGALGVFSYGWLVVEGTSRRLTWAVDFFATTNPIYRAWSALLPDYLNVTTTTWLLHAAWIAIAAGLLAGGSRATTAAAAHTPPRSPCRPDNAEIDDAQASSDVML